MLTFSVVGVEDMLPLGVDEVAIGLLLLLFGGKDKKFEAERRGLERAARIFTPILEEVIQLEEQLKNKYSVKKECFNSLIEEKAKYLKKLEQDIPRYKKAYEMKLKYDIEKSKSQCIGEITSTMGNGSLSTIATGRGGIIGGPLYKSPWVIEDEIKKREAELKAIENQGFENAKVMWEKQIAEHRKGIDIIKVKGDKESQELIKIYDECTYKVIEQEKIVAYYQERVGDLG